MFFQETVQHYVSSDVRRIVELVLLEASHSQEILFSIMICSNQIFRRVDHLYTSQSICISKPFLSRTPAGKLQLS